MLIHEHDFVYIVDQRGKCIVSCLSCNARFCKKCGKKLDALNSYISVIFGTQTNEQDGLIT